MNDRVSVVGLGKLGLGLALCLASRGIKTLGVDVNEDVVASINRGRTPIVEPLYQELIEELGTKFRATTSHAEAIAETDTTFILVATPSVGDGRFSKLKPGRFLVLIRAFGIEITCERARMFSV